MQYCNSEHWLNGWAILPLEVCAIFSLVLRAWILSSLSLSSSFNSVTSCLAFSRTLTPWKDTSTRKLPFLMLNMTQTHRKLITNTVAYTRNLTPQLTKVSYQQAIKTFIAGPVHLHKRSETHCNMSLNEPHATCLTKCACIPQRRTLLTNHFNSLCGRGCVFVYLVFAVSVNVLEILEGLDCVYVLSALLGNTFWSGLDQVLHKSHSLEKKKQKNTQIIHAFKWRKVV